MSPTLRKIMIGVAAAVALLCTVGAAGVADHTTHVPANDPTTKLNHSYVDDKDDDRADLVEPAGGPCHGTWQGRDCPAS